MIVIEVHVQERALRINVGPCKSHLGTHLYMVQHDAFVSQVWMQVFGAN